MHHFFYTLYNFFQKNKIVGILSAFLFLLLCGWLASNITFNEDITRIIPKNEKADVTSKVMKQLNFSDKITVLIEKDKLASTDEATLLAQSFYDSIQVDSVFIKDIQGYIDESVMDETYAFVNQNLPLFLEEEDYKTIEKKLIVDSLKATVQSNFNTLISPTGFVASKYIQQDPLGLTLIGLNKLQNQNKNSGFTLVNGFITSADSSKIVLFINPKFENSDTDTGARFAEYLYGIQHKLNQEFTGKGTISYFGATLVADANAKQIKSDIFSTIIVSMATLMLLLILFYRKISIPLIIFIPTLFAGAFALAVLYLIKPTISAISLSISAVLIGITIDYALHILTHYKRHTNPKLLYKEITKPLIMSATTNAVAFLCLLFVHSEALVDLGIFASVAILGSAIFSLLIIPHIYKPSDKLQNSSILDKISGISFEKNKVLIGICVFVIAISFFTFSKVGYNNDLSALNFVPSHLKQVEQKLDSLMHNQAKSIYVVSYGNSFDEVMKNHKSVEIVLDKAVLDTVIFPYNSIQNVVQSQQQQKQSIQKWNSFWQDKQVNVQTTLQTEGAKFGFAENAHHHFYNQFLKPLHVLSIADFNQISALATADFISEKDGFYTISTLVKLEESNRDAFLEQINKLENVISIDRKQLNETYLGQLKSDFNNLIDYSVIAVVLILWFFFRRFEWVLFSMTPIALTGLVTAGLMGLFNIEFNIFSAIVCTLVFGHGVDFSIFMTSALQKEYTTGKNELQTYRTSILLAVLTTVLAIGALIFAKHPALLSIASVSLIGVFSAVIITFVFYPLLFKILVINRVKKGKSPITFRLFILSVLFFIYYGFASLFTSIFSRIVLKFLPFSKKKRQDVFSNLMSSYMKSVLHLNPYVKNKFENPYNETFQKPAVIIANHTSFLDTLSVGMRVPKIIFIVNDWVWNSPVFGRVVRAAGFFPVSEGIEGGSQRLRDKIELGYSVMIFPEGTRSYNNTVKRFHKGAFYLAEQLNLDVVPFYIHGNSEVMPKGDFIVYDGRLSSKIGKRILASDLSFGATYSERTKAISKYFKSEFDVFRLERENENYFKKKLFWSYLYKEEDVINEVKADFNQNKTTYHALNSYFKSNEKIVHLADNYGQIDFILALQQTGRKIHSVIENDEKRAIAQSNYLNVHRNITFTNELIIESKLLISKKIDKNDLDFNKLAEYSEIILIKNTESIVALETLGFRIKTQLNQITYFVKN